jgi:hypothetical protein
MLAPLEANELPLISGTEKLMYIPCDVRKLLCCAGYESVKKENSQCKMYASVCSVCLKCADALLLAHLLGFNVVNVLELSC